MNNEKDMYTNSKIVYVDQEELRNLAVAIRQSITDLNNIKKNADVVWEQCSTYLDDSTMKSINLVKDDNYTKYYAAIDELNNYANKIETVANIWNETESEINASSRTLESLFNDISRSMRTAVEFSKKN